MEAAVGILATVVVALVGWILWHSSRCSDFHERVARLEEWKKAQEFKQ